MCCIAYPSSSSPFPHRTSVFSLSAVEDVVAYSKIPERTMKTIVYPKSLKDIPAWRRRQITQDLHWFTRYSPSERLDYVDREWAEIQEFIKDYSLVKHATGKPKKRRAGH
jgi:hypothetical protein